jgi:hypothetical protein
VRGKNTSEKAVQKKEARGRKETVEEVEHFSVSILPSSVEGRPDETVMEGRGGVTSRNLLVQ